MIALSERCMEISEEQLAARCRDGDLAAFHHLYARYEQNVFRYAYYLLGHREDAADIKQETFVKAWQAIGSFRGKASLLTWLLKICVNLCRDRLRSAESRTLFYERAKQEALTQDTNAIDPHAAAERSETVETIRRALQGLSPAQREILILHEIEGLDYREIARALGCTAGSAKMRLFRARHCLKDRVMAMMGLEE